MLRRKRLAHEIGMVSSRNSYRPWRSAFQKPVQSTPRKARNKNNPASNKTNPVKRTERRLRGGDAGSTEGACVTEPDGSPVNAQTLRRTCNRPDPAGIYLDHDFPCAADNCFPASGRKYYSHGGLQAGSSRCALRRPAGIRGKCRATPWIIRKIQPFLFIDRRPPQDLRIDHGEVFPQQSEEN